MIILEHMIVAPHNGYLCLTTNLNHIIDHHHPRRDWCQTSMQHFLIYLCHMMLQLTWTISICTKRFIMKVKQGMHGPMWALRKNGRSDENEVQFTLMIPVEDDDNKKMMMEERLHWCYSTNPAWRTITNKMKNEICRLLITFKDHRMKKKTLLQWWIEKKIK